MLVKCLIGKNQGLNSNHKAQSSKFKPQSSKVIAQGLKTNHKAQSSNLKVQREKSSKVTLMITDINYNLSLQVTCQLVNL